jgi:hypothetical protein
MPVYSCNYNSELIKQAPSYYKLLKLQMFKDICIIES